MIFVDITYVKYLTHRLVGSVCGDRIPESVSADSIIRFSCKQALVQTLVSFDTMNAHEMLAIYACKQHVQWLVSTHTCRVDKHENWWEG